MVALIIKKITLSLRIFKLFLLGMLQVLMGKMPFNMFLAKMEMNKVENRLCFWKTVYFNFRTMPAKYAWKTPVWVYGKTQIYDLSGYCLPLESTNIYPRMFVIGHMDQTRSCDTVTSITLTGTIYFGHSVVLRQGAKLRIGGKLILENNVYIGDNNTFIIAQACTIGAKSRIANNCTFMDTDIHYIIDVNTRMVKNNFKPITIGEGCWIGSYTMIKKGTVTPYYMIVIGPYSCLSKDYTQGGIPNYACVAGCPAKLIKTGIRRVNNTYNEGLLRKYFSQTNEPFFLDGNVDEFCSPAI